MIGRTVENLLVYAGTICLLVACVFVIVLYVAAMAISFIITLPLMLIFGDATITTNQNPKPHRPTWEDFQ